MIASDDILKQLPLDFETHNYMGRDDFMVSACNSEAFGLLEMWPRWIGFGAVIYGPKGCGKSHLVRIFADKVRSSAPKSRSVKIVEAEAVNMRNVKRFAQENEVLIVENLSAANNNEALFHLFNLFDSPNHWLLFTAEQAPARMRFALKDLQTRLNMLPCVGILEPDDIMLQMLIVKLFNDRQLTITPEILQYIVNNAQRSFAYIEALITEIDKISLAYQSSVSYTIVKQAMEMLDRNEHREPDLFDEY